MFYDQLRTPSFKGFAFALSNNAKGFGRDIKKNKVINGSRVYYEDTGVKETTFSIEAVIGGTADFLKQADAFEALLQEKGSGRLVLPDTGEMKAVVTDARRRTESNQVGLVFFTITFEKVDDAVTQTNVSTAAAVQDQASNTYSAALADFTGVYKSSVPDFVTDATTTQMSSFLGDLSSSLARAGKDFTVPSFSFQNGGTFGQQIIDMLDGLVAYDVPVDYSIAGVPGATDVLPVLKLVNALSGLTGLNEETVSAGTTTQTLLASNNQATDLMTKITTATAAAKAVSYANFESQGEALSVRDSMLSSLGTLREAAGDQQWGDSYRALGSLMAAVNEDIDTGLGRLPLTVTVRNNAVRSSLKLAHRLYGDKPSSVIAQADDIISRNGIVHPSFVPVEDLEVLVDA